MQDEQQGFRTGRSCVDAIFVIRQLKEKAIEFNRPAYTCFVDFEKAFDRVRLEDVINTLHNRSIPLEIIKTVEDMYSNNYFEVRVGNRTLGPIQAESGIRQGDSLSPLLFNVIMDEIVKKVKPMRGYRMDGGEVNILCFANDALLIASNNDDLQRMVNT